MCRSDTDFTGGYVDTLLIRHRHRTSDGRTTTEQWSSSHHKVVWLSNGRQGLGMASTAFTSRFRAATTISASTIATTITIIINICIHRLGMV